MIQIKTSGVVSMIKTIFVWIYKRIKLMKHSDAQLGKPEIFYKDTTSNIEAIVSPVEGMCAYSTDDHMPGYYNGTVWVWSAGGGLMAPNDWTVPTLLNSWENFPGGVFAPAGYYKDALGLVHLRGYVGRGKSGSIAFVLPTGYRPSCDLQILIPGDDAYLANIGKGQIYADSGEVQLYFSSGIYFDLASITFRTT